MKMLWAGMGWAKGNDEGQAVVDFAKRMELVISNTLFQKKLGHKIHVQQWRT